MWRRKQRLAAGDADLLDAEVDEDAGDALDLLEGQQLLARQEGVVVAEHFLGHAIHAAEVAAVGDRDAQVAHAAPAQVEQLALRRRGEVARRRQSTFGSPRVTTWSKPALRPAICSLTSYWSDQNQGVAVKGRSRPSSATAADLACSMAFCTDSRRCRLPSGRRRAVQSPAATMAGSEVRLQASTTMPLMTSNPAFCASSVFGDYADAHQQKVGGELAAVIGPHGGDAAILADEFRDQGAERHLDAVAAMQVEVELRDGRRHHACHQAFGSFQHGDLPAFSCARLRRLRGR
jgi:hypothetical protein